MGLMPLTSKVGVGIRWGRQQMNWEKAKGLPEGQALLPSLSWLLVAGRSHTSVPGGLHTEGKVERGTSPTCTRWKLVDKEALGQGHWSGMWAALWDTPLASHWVRGRAPGWASALQVLPVMTGKKATGRRNNRHKQPTRPSLHKQPPPTTQMQIFLLRAGRVFPGSLCPSSQPLPRAQIAGPSGWGWHIFRNEAGHRDPRSWGLRSSDEPLSVLIPHHPFSLPGSGPESWPVFFLPGLI